MKNLLPILILAPMLGVGQTEYVQACRAAYNIEVESAPTRLSVFTNSFVWATAEVPIFNAGTTNFEIVCFAKSCVGNFKQPVVNSQPTLIITNGIRALKFAGTDDYISRTNSVIPAEYTMMCWAKINVAQNNAVFIGGSSASGKRADIYANSANNLGGLFTTATNTIIAISSQVISTTDWVFLCATQSATTNRIFYNGTPLEYSVSTSSITATTAGEFIIGRNPQAGSGDTFLTGLIADAKLLDRALTTNEVRTIYNEQKGRYGL